MAKGQIKKVIFYLLPIIGLIVLASIFLVNLFPKAAGGSRNAILSWADKIAGKETVKAGAIVIEKTHLEAINNLKTTINKMKESSEPECYLSYQSGPGSDQGNNGFPALGQKGTKIVLEAVTSGTRVTVFGGEDGRQENSFEIIAGVTPCVISGGSVPQHFYDKFVLNTMTKADDSFGAYHVFVNKIIIAYNTEGYDENRIAYDNSGFLDFEDGGLLFKAGSDICFFPTVDDIIDPSGSCDGDSAVGLDDDCLGAKKNIISLSQGRLKQCGSGPKPVPPRLNGKLS
ncbi:MAG TPA: hypothetical protein VJH68_04530 [Candidatus Nanoarchaeia archaeon]|nr:hypothetical protein [Candidatus Nanoarchaeia archaeon]